MRARLKSGIEPLDEMLGGGFELGKLVYVAGDRSALMLSHLLVVRSSMPEANGGLGSSAIWLDGGITFDPYAVAEFSAWAGLDPEEVLKLIHISRAFTCYQLSSLVLEKLPEALARFGSKFVVISDLPFLYLDPDIPKLEALRAFETVLESLSGSSNRGELLTLVTSLGYAGKGAAEQMHEALVSNADVAMRARERREGFELKIEKPLSARGRKFFAAISKSIPLDRFIWGE